jgi:long-chain acyl-CoA synthetase
MLTHGQIMADVGGANKAGVDCTHEDRHLSYLPLAHMFERVVQVAMWQGGGAVGFFQGSPLKLLEDLAELHPTIFPSVPRLFNKIFDKISTGVAAKGGLAATLFNSGMNSKLANLRTSNELHHGFYDRLVFGKVAARLGLDRCRLMVTGSAPIAGHVLEFLRVVFSCAVVEGYGQTECTAAATVVPTGDQGTSGKCVRDAIVQFLRDTGGGQATLASPCRAMKFDSCPSPTWTTW